jgi:glycerophosphoryl diester phosphodiesterase
VLLLAHRGDHRRAPENTLAAFAAAPAIFGVDGIEPGVRRSAEGVAVACVDGAALPE